jgi:hypothetical protein
VNVHDSALECPSDEENPSLPLTSHDAEAFTPKGNAAAPKQKKKSMKKENPVSASLQDQTVVASDHQDGESGMFNLKVEFGFDAKLLWSNDIEPRVAGKPSQNISLGFFSSEKISQLASGTSSCISRIS